MKITLKLDSDSYNSYSTESIELEASRDTDYIVLILGERKVSIDKKEFLGAVNFLCF